MKKVIGFVLSLAWLGSAFAVEPQSAPSVSGVYTCIDSKGRKLTSDRPIPECTDREQRVLNPSGTTKQTVGPTLTAQERAVVDEKEKQALEERNRIAEEKRRDKALLNRYPNKGIHDQERTEALAQINVVKQAATNRLTELAAQRAKLNDEMEFYKKDPTKAPAYLRRQVEDNTTSTTVQKRFIVEQDEEARRVNQRFDDELARLRTLWPTISGK
jgi:hypothetical protein